MVTAIAGVELRQKGANVAFLLVHGFCAAPDEMATLGQYLSDRTIASFAVQLEGHNSTPEDLKNKTWIDWYNSAVNG